MAFGPELFGTMGHDGENEEQVIGNTEPENQNQLKFMDFLQGARPL